MTRVSFFPLLAMLALSGCSAGSLGSGGSGASSTALDGTVSVATQAACRQRVNEMYERRNRVDIYAANSAVNSPYSAGYQSGLSSRALSGQFDFERTLRECERNSGTGAERPMTPATPVAAPSAAKPR